jgi:hypothetical protein
MKGFLRGQLFSQAENFAQMISIKNIEKLIYIGLPFYVERLIYTSKSKE